MSNASTPLHPNLHILIKLYVERFSIMNSTVILSQDVGDIRQIFSNKLQISAPQILMFYYVLNFNDQAKSTKRKDVKGLFNTRENDSDGNSVGAVAHEPAIGWKYSPLKIDEEIEAAAFAYLHQRFIESTKLIKMLHFQGYSGKVLPFMVDKVPSMRKTYQHLDFQQMY
ncbi:hypothetical protein HK101_008458 [Irineochytrium annulatum]|nr:hypothetical protein HK101_008458 [Irineochytrium annulatum]